MRVLLVLTLLLGCAQVAEADDLRSAIDAALIEQPAQGRLVRDDVHPIGGAGEPKGPWTFELGIGVSLAQGNSDHFDLHVDGRAIYERGRWLVQNEGLFVYGESDGSRAAENWHTEHRLDRKLGACSHAFAKLNFDRDELADLEYRLTGLGGFGRTLAQGPNGFFKGEIGGGAVHEKRLGASATTSPSAYLGLDLERTWNDGKKLTIEYDFVANLNDFDLSFMVWDLQFATPLCTWLDLTLGLRLDYVFEPPGTAKSLDILMVVGLKVRLD